MSGADLKNQRKMTTSDKTIRTGEVPLAGSGVGAGSVAQEQGRGQPPLPRSLRHLRRGTCEAEFPEPIGPLGPAPSAGAGAPGAAMPAGLGGGGPGRGAAPADPGPPAAQDSLPPRGRLFLSPGINNMEKIPAPLLAALPRPACDASGAYLRAD